MSHNWRSYTKKNKRSDSANTKPIDAFFKNDSSKTVESQQDSKVIDIEHYESESRQLAAVALSPSNTVADIDSLPINNETEISKLTSSSGLSTEKQLKTFPIIRSTPATLFSKPDETQPKRDSRSFNSQVYESRYPLLYHSQTKHGFMCKYCEIFGSSSDPNISYVTTGAVLGDNTSRRLETHNNSDRDMPL
ncbi:hypothetical protein DPMN_049128 [Dreissena polymorpha]|uniref:Uncharacterized protein n=1 Tax=Dreissena polymorpha TaxID=45954 RepID=A0A9D4DDM3_DREPO|nr:hypothetical protein DPMN_049128 [Dreissena polymorpha]